MRIERVSGADDRRCSARTPILRDLYTGMTAQGEHLLTRTEGRLAVAQEVQIRVASGR